MDLNQEAKSMDPGAQLYFSIYAVQEHSLNNEVSLFTMGLTTSVSNENSLSQMHPKPCLICDSMPCQVENQYYLYRDKSLFLLEDNTL